MAGPAVGEHDPNEIDEEKEICPRDGQKDRQRSIDFQLVGNYA